MPKIRSNPSPTEETNLLPENSGDNGGVTNNNNRSRSNAASSPSSPNNPIDNDQLVVSSNDQVDQPKSSKASHKMILAGILSAFGMLALLCRGYHTTGMGPSRWDDETHHAWQEFLAERNDASSSSFDMASGSLLRPQSKSDSATATTTAATTKVAPDSIIPNEPYQALVYFNQSTAFGRLDPLHSDLYHYQNGWEAQITQALCAVATTAALINSLRYSQPDFELPQDPTYVPFPWATQKQILASASDNDCVLKALGGSLVNAAAVYHVGLGLTMVPRLANCFLEGNGYQAITHQANDDADPEAIKQIVIAALKDPSKRVVYNYDRGGIGQGPMGHGHWSPLGGYHPETDSFLIMDVAKYKHPMVWVSWEDLWGGANTLDGCGQMLTLKPGIDWNSNFVDISKYLKSRCIPGNRGFVVAEPILATAGAGSE